MKNFVDLNETENYEIKKTRLKSKPTLIEEVGIDLPKMVLTENLDKEDICIMDGDASDFYGNREKDGSFKVENLFSELVNEYERAIARQNLGIGDSQTLNWGNIKGNIRNQEDLKDYVFNSPKFNGLPTAPTQTITDSSNAIATTEWVVNYVSQNGGGGGSSNPNGLKFFTIDPNGAMMGDEPVVVNVKWDYDEIISSQKLNGVDLNILLRNKTFSLSETTTFDLEYVIDDKNYIKKLSFIFSYPLYYGTSSNYEQLEKTLLKSFNFITNDGEYLYLILPVENAILAVNGFVGGFEQIDEQDLHGIKYYTYKSVNHSLGELIVNLLN